ncbi:MAG: hypothetical protein QOH39_2744, partial [Verrucomicrobiota bacterium]
NQIGEFTDRPFPHCVTSSWPHNLLNKVPLLMGLRRVSSALRFLLPDYQGQRTVHV